MKAASVSLLLGVCVLLLSALTVSAVSLSVSPNLQQFFRGSSPVSLSCVDDGQTVDGWTVKRTRGGLTEVCGEAASFGRIDGSSCILDLFVHSGGSYSCINSSGQQSDKVSISVSDDSPILEIPALPVRTGSDITLHCRQKNGDTVAAYFFFNERRVASGRKSEHTITSIQKSDEGLYSCSTDTLGSSPQSFLRVRALPPHVQSTTACTSPGISAPPSSPTALPPPLFSSSIIPVVAGLVSVVLLVLVGVLLFYRKLKVSQHASVVEVYEGEESVLLLCQVPVFSDSAVVWDHSDSKPSTVHVRLQSGDDLRNQSQRYTNRTSMRADALQTGDLSLTLRNPTGSDSGTYTCTVHSHGQDMSRKDILLKVKGQCCGFIRHATIVLTQSEKSSFCPTQYVRNTRMFSCIQSEQLQNTLKEIRNTELFCHLVVFCPYCISTGLLLSICWSRKTPIRSAIFTEMTQQGGGGQGLGEDYDITADVTTEHAF
ncbi:uncharacterized protein LOC115775651 [Archocentrus centrarchus]|uniref:uncharacterized protein LOC115775651 n=1 Tax=Archocentrus centrarchus TaxID=63155 RepID=UPI0011E9FAE0|nr:uncharacterized protein LOC115775651 [Archocentrus centrarchus]